MATDKYRLLVTIGDTQHMLEKMIKQQNISASEYIRRLIYFDYKYHNERISISEDCTKCIQKKA